VGAVANAGSDLSYDLSSNSSAGLDLNVNGNGKKGSTGNGKSNGLGGDSDVDMDGDHQNNNGNVIGNPRILPNEVIIRGNDDDDDDDDDDDVSLDEERLKHENNEQMLGLSGDLGLDSGGTLNAVIIQDLSQLNLGSQSADLCDGDHGGDDEDDDDDDDEDDDNEDDKIDEDGIRDLLSSLGPGVELSLEHIAEWIKSGKCSKIVVLCGAGVSCSAGIPDFRTPGTGLYDNLEKYNLPYPEAVFDLSFYQSNPLPFVSLAKEIWPGMTYSPTLSHSFISLLSSKKLLLRNYTQNIDGLELLSGVDESKIVECHGHFRTASCIACGVPYDGKKCRDEIVDSVVPTCPKCGCLVKPDIVFFGESLPVRFKNLLHSDLGSCDLLIVMGTSLKVAPVSLIPEMVNSRTPRVLMNRELVGDFVPPGVEGNYRDVFQEGDCDDSVRKLCSFLGWEEELLEMNEKTRLG